MRCIGCDKVHKHSQKGYTWLSFQLCPKCFKVEWVNELICQM